MKKALVIAAIQVFFSIQTSTEVFAHPGGTAADGCHYCRTNCAKWGEVEGARHCHNGGSEAVETFSIPVNPAPTVKPTIRPVVIARPTIAPKPSATPTPMPSPTIMPTSIPQPTQLPTIEPSEAQSYPLVELYPSPKKPARRGFFQWVFSLLGL
jgi:hypothetical protein